MITQIIPNDTCPSVRLPVRPQLVWPTCSASVLFTCQDTGTLHTWSHCAMTPNEIATTMLRFRCRLQVPATPSPRSSKRKSSRSGGSVPQDVPRRRWPRHRQCRPRQLVFLLSWLQHCSPQVAQAHRSTTDPTNWTSGRAQGQTAMHHLCAATTLQSATGAPIIILNTSKPMGSM